ncbi:DUF3320 domain-containing protein [Bacteroides oleiciplenus]|uniref:DUF3320 domain-containing protein n=1 Tax=Bacteroides oleiciplenus YIT 12058 TaxID=742727 RepID=K9DXD5_9BACE|nr:DUF3320 domain-containing protein [Bacteroides oleiciplenus]EKU89143.1 hypothetical protein HMPREF9447_03468 [Bacteroides oleiciplenus YIT 12058]
MGNDNTITGTFNGTVHLEYLPCINYAMIHNHVPSCNFCELMNNDEVDWNHIKVSIDGELIKHSESILEIIPKGQNVQINSLEIFPENRKLIELTEGIDTHFNLTITISDEIAHQQTFPIKLMAYDQWTGASIMPELLVTFVTPNHPILSRISVKASQFLEKWTGSSALDEYQTQNPNRVRAQVAAIYEALRSESLIYSTVPASFETMGQRIRLVDNVLTSKLGTCIDLTLLYASCLEANGIHPLLVLLKGHIFVGAWLTEDIYHQTVGDDASFLLKGSANGISDIVLVETTALTSSQNISFEEAVTTAQRELKEESNFELFIDVYRCRLDKIRPLPQRINHNGEWQIENNGIEHENATRKVNQLDRYEIKLDDSKDEITKQVIWERKLLDFSLRNNLINIRLGRRVIPFISFAIDHLEDHLQAGENYQILASPTKSKIEPGETGLYDSSLWKESLEELVISELKNKKIRSYLTESELQNSLKFVYRTSRTAIEENGANSLFLVLGVLKWYESTKSVKPRFAPILLLPVDIIRRGGTSGYIIRTRDEEIILNITLVELLKQQFGVNLSGLNPLPKDDSGVDLKKIFAAIRTCIRNMKGWDVVEESMLGLFSFNKFVMWNDIHSNADKLKENPIIASLMENRIQWQDTTPEVDAREIDKNCKPINFSIPVDVDSSQLEAVIESGEGKSFILHGPPGTGKSQTITNMIANALYKGKRVLFVAEKMAALSVVQNRLTRIGLSPFCLELHSNKVTKSHFLAQLQKAIEAIHIQSPVEFESTSTQLFERRRKLIDYMEALHHPHASGFSLYDCITNYLSIQGDELSIDFSLLNGITKDKLTAFCEKIQELDTVFLITGHPQEHPLKGLEPYNTSLENCQKLQNGFRHLIDLFNLITANRKSLSNNLGISIPDSWEGINWMSKISDLLLSIPYLNKSLLEISGNANLIEEWKDIILSGRERDRMQTELGKNYAPQILQENVFILQQEWKAIEMKWFLPKFFAKRSYLKKLRLYNTSLQAAQIPGLLERLDAYQKNNKIVQEQSSELSSFFGFFGKKNKERWDDIASILESLPMIYSALMDFAEIIQQPFTEVLNQFTSKVSIDWNTLQQSNEDAFRQSINTINELNAVLNGLKDLCYMQMPDNDLEMKLPVLLNTWLAHFNLIKDWGQWCIRKKELESQHLSEVINYITDKHKTGLEAADAYMKGVYHQLAIKTVDADETLRLFNGLLFEEMINKYKLLTTEFQELSKKELYCRLAAKIPSLTMEAASSSEIGILKRNISNGGRGTSIRRIIDQIPTLLPKLCPCMLMSPISVAQYIDLDAEKFDLVIFDEASQMPTSEAVGAIARGKALVVVGDPKQMPPTSFFSSSQVDEEEAEFDDMESILDDCISLSIPSRYLTWHYRSKHESLIAFSNSQYYNGKLYTFPSVDDRVSKVRLVQVNGSYDKGRTRSNHAEAEAIVKEILHRLQTPELSERSIGVVSFSQVQQNLIEDMLIEELNKYPELEEKAFQSNEPIFIKNLENVQGDERDIILFSIGYGPDKNGNVSMNFGPLNNQGGERRLNVAVSRARYEMIIFSTLRSEQIDLKRTKSRGVEGLKKFLEFAERGTSPIPAVQLQNQKQSDLITLIAQELTQRGYKVDTLVGRSNFKVDLAIVNPEQPDTYILGILCDGKNYYETKTTRDREIVQPNVLQMLHWNVMRVWSVDWFEHKENVVERIIKKLEDVKKVKVEEQSPLPIQPAVLKTFSIENEPVVELVNSREKEYVFADLPEISYSTDIDKVMTSSYQVKRQLEQIVRIEQPITNTLLYKRILRIWKLTRVTTRLQGFIDDLLKDVYKDPLSGNSIIYWESEEKAKNADFYRINSKRDILDIPVLEVMSAARYAIEQQISMPIEDLKRLTSQLLGFSRKGANLDMVTEQAIQILINRGIFKCTDGMVSMNN